jgi:ABC-type lipoprotein export system ATPase subunit/ABC-type transporter Mla maintaining outer membrane lipid asymmetry permease subunit MlaE
MSTALALPGSFLRCRDFALVQRAGHGELVLLQGTDLELAAGGFYVLVGQSGSGKTSLLRILAGLVEPREVPPQTRGELSLLGQRMGGPYPASLRGRVGAILQDEGLLDELSPRENVELALRAAGRSRRLALALLGRVGLDPAPARTSQLSGGMKKRLAVARALAAEPQVLLCDEPTSGLDPAAARQIAELLRDSNQGGRTTLVVTHEPGLFADLATAVIAFDPGTRSLRAVPPGEAWRPGTAAAAAVLPASEGQALHGLRQRLLQLASVGETVAESLYRLPPTEGGQVARMLLRCIVEPMPFVAVAGAVIGGLATFFALRNNPIQGAFEGAVLTGSGKVLTAVLVPMLSGFFFTARMAAGAAARLGTMKRTQQIAALQTMGVRPADYLLTPLVWGMTLGLPVVTAAGCVASSLAALLAARMVAGTTTLGWAVHFFQTVDAVDLRMVALKSALSGYLVAITAYHLATGPKHSGRDVGEAVNASIVLGMALVLAVHAALTFWQYS